MFSKAIVKTPGKSLIDGISNSGLGIPDYMTALRQHADYVSSLKGIGLEVTELEADEQFPDSTFVEDVALMTPHCAILTNPGAPSRRDETRAMLPILYEFYDKVEMISAPGTVEAGDIMMVREHFYIGLSARTNLQGAQQLIAILENHGMTGSVVSLTEVLHLKTGMSYLENNNLLVCGEFLDKQEFKDFNLIQVDQNEAYAANSVWINDVVLVPDGFPATRQKIEACGYSTIALDVSEFQKLDGGLSCLSLRF